MWERGCVKVSKVGTSRDRRRDPRHHLKVGTINRGSSSP